jgi:exopolysaccharide biosynthesis polyprenyl glycosylphosphotransferase
VWQRSQARRLLLTDTCVVLSAIVIGQYVRFGRPSDDQFANRYITLFSLTFAALWLGALSAYSARSARVIGAGADEYRRVVSASFSTFGAIAIITLLLRLDVARGYLAVALPTGTVGLLLGRKLWRDYMARQRANGHLQTVVMAIGAPTELTLLANELTRHPRDGYRIVGVGIPGYGGCRDEFLTVRGQQIPILGDELCALAALGDLGADTLAVTDTEHFGMQGIRRLTWQLEALDIDLVVSPGVMDVTGARLMVRPVAGLPLLHVEKPQYLGAKQFQKRAFDFCFALAALLGTSPLLISAAIAIKLTSRGPTFYSAERIGLDGEPFTMLKFRSMVDDADLQLRQLLEQNEVEGGTLFKMREDPRVTPVGRLLRRFSIDELPQFINVLRGDMSVVGPRPPLRREVATYDGEVRRRLLVKPGITGLWQVSGRSNLSWDESVRLDLSYVENWSMVSDLVIIAKTLKAVMGRDGAY